jgi:hypothetical protein
MADSEKNIEEILNQMKQNGITGAVIRKDGVVMNSTVALSAPAIISSLANISDAILQKEHEHQKELEIAFNNLILVVVPVKNCYFCGMVKERAQKKLVRDYAEQASAVL